MSFTHDSKQKRNTMNRLLMAPMALIALMLGLLAPMGAATAAASEWNDGKSDADMVWDCILQKPSTGVSANVGWSSPSGQVPKVGEVFYLRGYIGLVSVPCSGQVAVLPEVMPPAGVEYADGPVMWDLTKAGDPQQLDDDELSFFAGMNGGVVIALPGDKPFELSRGDILEFQFPVIATRELKGPATQQPECNDRRTGKAPCPVSQAGDHFQVAFTVGGHGGNKSYVTPYVGLFAAKPASTPAPSKVASKTAATYQVKPGKRGKAVVTVSASRVPTGNVVVTDKGRVIAKGKLATSSRGRVTLRLPRLTKGVHKLQVEYLGSTKVKPSISKVTKLRLR